MEVWIEIEIEVGVKAKVEVLVVMKVAAEVWARERVGAAVLDRGLCVCTPGPLRH